MTMPYGFDKALSTTSGQGGDLIIPKLADRIIPFIRQRSYFRQFFPSFPMPSPVFRFPKLTQGNDVYYVGEATVSEQGGMTTGTVELTARKLMTRIELSSELDQDSIIPISGIIRDDIAKAFAYAEERVFILGNPNHLATSPTRAAATETNWFVQDARRAFQGIIINANAPKFQAGGNKIDLDAISTAIENLNVFGRQKEELLLAVSLREENYLRILLGINLTLNSLGLTGTALPSEIGKVFGVPVVATNILPKTLGATADRSESLLLNKNFGVIGDRRQFELKSSDEILMASDQVLVVASERIAFAPNYPEACTLITDLGTT